MDRQHTDEFKSLESMNSNLSDATRRHGPRDEGIYAPRGHLNPAFGDSDEHLEMGTMNGHPSHGYDMMIDMTNGSQHTEDDSNSPQRSRDDDELSVASTDTYQSGTSMSSVEAELRENLPSQLFREIRNLPSAKTRRKIIQEGRTPQGTVRHRPPGSVRGGLDETDFVLMADEHQAYSHEGIRHMATSLDRKKVALYVK